MLLKFGSFDGPFPMDVLFSKSRRRSSSGYCQKLWALSSTQNGSSFCSNWKNIKSELLSAIFFDDILYIIIQCHPSPDLNAISSLYQISSLNLPSFSYFLMLRYIIIIMCPLLWIALLFLVHLQNSISLSFLSSCRWCQCVFAKNDAFRASPSSNMFSKICLGEGWLDDPPDAG